MSRCRSLDPTALALCLCLLSAMVAGCRGQLSESPPVHLNLNMDFQTKVGPQAADDFFPDKRGMRLPPAGTIAYGHLKADDHYHRGKTGGAFATSLPSQIPLTKELLVRGQERFGIYCVPCHDAAGTGNGIVTKRGMLPPTSYHDPRLLQEPVGYVYDVITNGKRTMLPYAGQIGTDDRWAIAAYVKALQVSRQGGPEDVPAEVSSAKGWR